ncbi:MAG: hypothetical protein ABJA80_04025 [bacterium]
MITPQLVVGRGGGVPAMLAVGVGYEDDDVAYELLGRSAAWAPAGTGGECAFHSLYVTTRHFEDDVSLFVTTYIDGVPLPEVARITLVGVPLSMGEQQVHEIALSLPYAPAGVELLRYAPRGTWIIVQIETKIVDGFGTAAKQMVDGVECEYEVVQETKVNV